MPIAALALGAAASIGGAAISAHATKKATNKALAAQTQMNSENNALARENRDLLTAKIDPFYQSGVKATGTLNALLGLGGDTAGANASFRQYIDNSDYAFQENQGERGLGARLSSAGGVESGAAQKQLQQYRTNLQSGYRGQYMGGLAQQQGVGVSATNALTGVGTNFVNTVTNNNQNLADSQSNAALLKGRANAGLYAGIGNALGQFAGAFNGGGGFGGSFKGFGG
jgi:hypothetical protein